MRSILCCEIKVNEKNTISKYNLLKNIPQLFRNITDKSALKL